MNTSKNYYEILEIPPDSTPQEVERAYLEAKETYSPSSTALYSMFSPEEAGELHRLIEEAYRTLSNRDKRRQYDLKVFSQTYTLQRGEDQTSVELKAIENQMELEPKQEPRLRDGKLESAYKQDESMEKKIEALADCSGAFLQKVRKYKNISLETLSEFSKISKTNILAIEEEDFDNLPAKVFTRGFALQLSRLLGLDSQKFSKSYANLIDEHKNKK